MIIEYVLAFYLAIFFLGRFVFDNFRQKAYKAEFEAKTKWLGQFIADWSRESELSKYAKRSENRDAIFDALSDNLKAIFGDNYREEFLPWSHYGRQVSVSNHILWATRLLLSKEGKCAQEMYINGYSLGGIDDVDLSIKFCREIEKNIQKFDGSFKLVLKGKPIYNDKHKLIRYDYKPSGKQLGTLWPYDTNKNYRRLW